jgi:hypothetical protein
MIDKPLLIPVSELGGESQLVLDYLSGNETPIREIMGGFGRGDERWGRPPEPRAKSESWAVVIDRMIEYNRSLGVAQDVVNKLLAARDGGAVSFVVAGQQPGALGGPLLALYKLATAVELAEHVEQTGGAPCIPLYWVGSDDVDFREIRDLFLVDCELTPLSTSIEQAAYKAASPIGDIPARSVERVWESVEPLIARCPHGAYANSLVRASIEGAADHGMVTARLLAALSGGRAAMVDGREPSVRVHARDLFLEFFDRETEVRESVEEAGLTLESHGYHAQLWLGPDSGVFMVEDGRRKKITGAQRAQARDELASDVTRFSPGVALRNLVQDHVFQPAAVVLGPAEIAYRVQLDGVYCLMDVARPVAFPRMQASYLPPPVAALPGVAQPRAAAELLTDPSSFVNELYAARRTDDIDASAGRFRRAFEGETASFLEAGKAVLDDRTLEKTRKRLVDLSRRLDQALNVGGTAGKAAALREWPFLAGLAEFIKRKDRGQDRYMSSLTPFVFGGEGARSSVSSAAVAHVQAALDGSPSHVVYSSRV